MEINWYGHSCFRLTERNYATVVTDPYNSESAGYSPLKLRGDIVTVEQMGRMKHLAVLEAAGLAEGARNGRRLPITRCTNRLSSCRTRRRSRRA